MAYAEPVNAGSGLVQVNTAPRKPRILLAACGCVAAMQFTNLLKCFSGWADVRGVITNNALHFLDIPSIPRDVYVYTDQNDWCNWTKMGDAVLHIELSQWADIMIIAPLSANTLGKIAGGLCDNLLTCIVRAWDYDKQIFIAPAMNTYMWTNSLTEKHLMSLDEMGISLISPVSQSLGTGAMAEPSLILSTVRLFLERKARAVASNRQIQSRPSHSRQFMSGP